MDKKDLELRNAFLQKEKDNLQNVDMRKIVLLLKKAVKENNKKMLKYESIVSIGAENTGARLNKVQYAKLLENIYKYWWDHALIPKYNSLSPATRECYDKYVKNEEFIPTSKHRIENIFEILEELQDISFMGLWSPIYFQGKYFCDFYANDFSIERTNFSRRIDVKLYLHIKLKNTLSLAHKIIKKALTTNTPLLFKIATYDARNDNFVFYTNYKDIYSLIELIETVRAKNPELFSGCKIDNPLMGTYNNYIGFGEEPYSWGSYVSVRTDILEKSFNELKKIYNNKKSDLTNEKILETLKFFCKREKIDEENFYLNNMERFMDYEME